MHVYTRPCPTLCDLSHSLSLNCVFLSLLRVREKKKCGSFKRIPEGVQKKIFVARVYQ